MPQMGVKISIIVDLSRTQDTRKRKVEILIPKGRFSLNINSILAHGYYRECSRHNLSTSHIKNRPKNTISGHNLETSPVLMNK